MSRVFNFSAGPSTLPIEVLKEAQEHLLEHKQNGMSVMEMSHRSKMFGEILHNTESLLRKLMNVPETHHILFIQGGATLQFSMIPLNLLTEGKTADYVNTGKWANGAIKEAKKVGNVNVVASSEDKKYSYIPKNVAYDDDAAYVHITSNNTVAGTQYHEYPKTKATLVCDMSSDIMSRQVNVSDFGLIYAGAQKNIGIAGATIVIVRDDLLGQCPDSVPVMLNYKKYADAESMPNTPPCFAIYMIELMLKHLEAKGGIAAMEKHNIAKAKMLYDAIDNSDGFYVGKVALEDRSLMNVTFDLQTEELEKKFLAEAQANGLVNLKGHRSIGGCRASIYNAMSMEGVEALVAFMNKFKANNK